jgi:hypothetical protein
MSREEDKIRFHFRRGTETPIPFPERKKTSDSI